MNDDQKNYTSVNHLLEDRKKKEDEDDQPKSVALTKEGEPIKMAVEKTPVKEMEISEDEPHIEDKEVKKYLEVKRDEPEIHPDLLKAGLNAVNTSSLDPKHKVQLPLSDEKIIKGLHQPISSSLRWLAEFALFMLKQAHLTLKEVHGKVVRIMQK